MTMPVPHHSVFAGWMPLLSPSQQRQSTKGTKVFVIIIIIFFIPGSIIIIITNELIILTPLQRMLYIVCDVIAGYSELSRLSSQQSSISERMFSVLVRRWCVMVQLGWPIANCSRTIEQRQCPVARG